MAQEAFHYHGGVIPSMDVEEIVAHLQVLDGEVYFSLLHCLDESDRHDKSAILSFIHEADPVLFEALENILRAFQSAFFVADEARATIMRNYQRYRIIRRALAHLQETPATAVAKKKKEKRTAPKKGEKRKLSEEDELREDEQTEKFAELLGRSECDTSCATTWFSQCEEFNSAFPHADYVHFVPKNHKRMALESLVTTDQWKLIYHVNGPWAAEKLREVLEQQGEKALIVKRRKGGPDAEIFAYKVISTGGPTAPQQTA